MSTVSLLPDTLNKLNSYQGILTIDKFIEYAGNNSILFMIWLLSIPTSIPTPPLGPEHMPFAFIQWSLIFQLWFGSSKIWIPSFAKQIKIDTRTYKYKTAIEKIKNVVSFFSTKKNRHINTILFGKVGEIIFGLNVLLMAFLMFIPVPLTNVIPSMMVTITSFGFLLQNPFILLFGYVLSFFVFIMYFYILKWCFKWVMYFYTYKFKSLF